MQLKRAYTAEPVSDETIRRLKMGRNRTRMIGLIAAGGGAMLIPAWIAGVGMGVFKLEDKTITVFPRVMTEDDARAETLKVEAEAQAFREQKAEEKKAP